MDEEVNVKMLDHLQKYVPHLEKLILQLKDPKKKNKELQLSKLEGLLSMITDRKKKLKLDTLKKCEDVILKILQKVHPTIYKQMEQTEQRSSVPYAKFLCKNPPGEINPLAEAPELKTARLQAARARLNEFSTPASPSPPRDISIITPPIVIPTEKVPRKCNPDDFHIKSWEQSFDKHPTNCNSEVYKTEKPDVYRRAAESLTANANKKPVFERLGTRVDMSVPPLSAEDLKKLTESDTVTVTDLEYMRDDLKKKLIQEEDKCQVTDLRLKLTRDRQKEHQKSSNVKPRVEKIFKDPDSKFGSLLSSIDDKILEKKDDKRPKSDKDRDRDKHRHKSKKRDRSKERHRSKDRKHYEKDRDKEKEKKKDEGHKKENDKKEEKVIVKERKEEKVTDSNKPKEEEPEKQVFKRLADKYNPRPRKNSIDIVERSAEIVSKEAIPHTDKETLLSTVKSSLLRNIDETLLSNVKEALLSSKDALSRNPVDKLLTNIKDAKTDNDQYLTNIKDTYCTQKPIKDINLVLNSKIDKLAPIVKEAKKDNNHYLTIIKDTYCPQKPIKDISLVLNSQIDKFAPIVKDAKKDNDQYLTNVKDTYYPPKPVNEMWSPTYGMMPQKNLEFVPPATPAQSGNTIMNTFILQNNVSSNVPHNQYAPSANTFQNAAPSNIFHPYEPIPNTNHYEMNQMQPLDYYSHNQHPTYQNRPYQQQYTRDRQHPNTWNQDSRDRQQSDTWTHDARDRHSNTWNHDPRDRQHSDSWNHDPRDRQHCDTWKHDPRDRQHSDTWNHDPRDRQHSDTWNHDPRTSTRRDENSRSSTFSRDPRIRSREEKEAAQKMIFAPPPQTKRRSVEEYPTYGHSRYDMMYNQDRIKNDDTFTSPLDSLYSTGNDNQRTGKGYGVQKFRIPKRKTECEEPKIEENTKSVDDENIEDERRIDVPMETNTAEVKDSNVVENQAVTESSEKEVNEEKESESGKASVAEQAMLTNFFADFLKNANNKTVLNALLCSIADNTGDKNKYKQILKIMNSDENEVGNEGEDKSRESSKIESDKDDKVCEVIQAMEEVEVVKETSLKVVPTPRLKIKKKPKNIKKVALRKSSRNKLKAKKAAELAVASISENSDSVVETVGERIKNRKRNVPTTDTPKHRKCTELDRLHNDIKEMFICDGVLTATGKRMCRILKSESTHEKESVTPDSPKASKSKEDDTTILDSPKRRARTSNPKVLIEKTDLSKLVSTKVSSDSDSDSDSPITRRVSKRRILDLESTPESSPIKSGSSTRSVQRRAQKNKPNYIEPSEDEFPRPKSPKPTEAEEEDTEEKEETDTTPEKLTEKKGLKKKRRGHNWAIGVINKKVSKKKVNISMEDTNQESEAIKPTPDEEKQETQQHDISYYVEPLEKSDCKLCPFKGKFIVQHYRTIHPQNEVLISRISPENAQNAIEESNENNYKDVEPVDIYEAKNRKKRFTYQCRFCQAVYKNEFSETFFDHITSHTGEYRFHCSSCPFKTSNVKALRSHRYSSHQSNTEYSSTKPPSYPAPPNYSMIFGYICEQCNFIQLDKSSLESHVENNHKDANICKINMSTVVSKSVNDSIVEVELDMSEKIDEKEVESENLPEQSEISEEKTDKVVDKKIIEKPKEDPTVFKSNPDDTTENLKMEEQKHEKMQEINQTVIPKKKFSFDLLDRIKSRLDNKTTEEDENREILPGCEGEIGKCAENVTESIQPLDISQLIKLSNDTINVDKVFHNKNSQPITNIIERLHGKLNVESLPPPLIPINEFPITPKVEEIVVQVGPIAARKKNDYVLYMCYMQSCMFSSTNAEEFEIHCKTFHHNKQWDGVCNVCDLKTNLNEIEDAYNHLISAHGSDLGIEMKDPSIEMKSSYLRMRRLSGDILSEQKPLITLSEETPFKIVDVQTQQDEDDSFNFPFQIANVTTLTPEEDQALNATAPISIVTPSLSSLVTSPLSSLTVISTHTASGSATNVTSSITTIPSYNILVPYIPPLVTSSPKKSATPVLLPLAKSNVVPNQSPAKVSTSKKVVLKDVPLQAHELIAPRKTRNASRILLTEQKLIHLYKCPEMSCSFSTDTKRLFEVHLQQHSEYKPGIEISCLYCNFKTDFRLFAVHCDVRHGRCQFCCNYCFYRAVNQSYVEMHQERDHPRNKRRILKAPVNSDALTSQAHLTLPPINSIVPFYICGVTGCESKFIFQQDFVNHCVNVHCGSAISCYHCTYTASSGNNAAVHMQMHNVCYFHCRYCLYGGNTLHEVHNHLSLQHFALIPRILERKFIPDGSNKASSDYKWDDPKAYDRLNVLTAELTKYVTPSALIEVVSYGSNQKAVINVMKTSLQDKNDTITLYKAPTSPLQKKQSVSIIDASVFKEEISKSLELPKGDTTKTSFGDTPPIVLNNFLKSPADLLTITRITTKQKDDVGVSVTKQKDGDENNRTSSNMPDVLIMEVTPEPINIDESFDDIREETTCAKVVEEDPLQLDEEVSRSVPESTSNSVNISTTSDSILDISSNVTFVEDELSDFMSDQIYDSATSDDNPTKSKGFSGKELFRCGICRDAFDTAQLFKLHVIKCVETHRSGVGKPFACWHCFKMFKTVNSLLDHIRIHGTNRFACSLCDYKQSHQFHVRSHMKARHNVPNATMMPVNSEKNNVDEDEFVLKPKIIRQKSSEITIPKDLPNLGSETILEFGPEDVDSLPLREIYSKEVKCSACGYGTKVRANLIRHFQFHKTGKEVPIPAIAPVNPVPCLDKNEKMFDKMFNLSISSYNDAIRKTDKKDQPKMAKEEDIELPTFVPVTKRYVCGANNCDYLCLEESMLRSHLQALHSDETSYICMHCKEILYKGKGVINIDQILKHLRLHDLNLYKCHYCKFLHNLKHKVDRHVLDKHPTNTPLVIIIREMDHEVEESSHIQEDVKEAKPWRCSMCKYRCSTKTEIVAHAHNKHELDTQFKCALCQYRTSTKSNFASHFQLEHPGRNVDVIDAYYEEEAVPAVKTALDLSLFDTTPIWQREKTKLKHIRGIPIEETVKLPKKSFPKFDDKTEIKKFVHVPSKRPKTVKEKKLELVKDDENEIIEIEDDDNLLMIDDKPKIAEKSTVVSASASQSDEDKMSSSGYTVDDLLNMDITTLKNANLSCAYGPFGVPHNRQFSCPNCNSFKTKKTADITNHLYKHQDYHKFVCTICRLTGITYNFLKRHSAKKHVGLPEAIYPMTPDPQIEDWVRKVLLVQTRIMEETDNIATVSSTTIQENETSAIVKKPLTTITEIIAADSSSTLAKPKIIHQCQHCSYSCRAASDLRKHERRHWVQKPLRCGYCDCEGVTNYEIHQHSKRAHPNVEPVVVTVPTPSIPAIRPIIRKRKYPKNEGAITSSSDEVPAKITMIDSDDSFSKSEDGDTETKKGMYNYRCGHCSVVGHLDIVKTHFKSAHPDLVFSAFRYQCKYCNKYFKNIDKVRAHYKYGHNDSVETCFDISDQSSALKEYTCEYCHTDFIQQLDLINHHNMLHSHLKLTIPPDVPTEPTTSKTANNEKKLYKCSQDLCNYLSSTYAAMRDHVRVHAKPFQCGYCPLRFIYPSYAKTHLRKEHPDLEPSYHTSPAGATLYAELRSNIMVLNDKGEYQKIKSKVIPANKKRKLSVDVVKQTARKSTTQINVPKKPTARKSTTYIPPPPPSPPPMPTTEEDPGCSFYGNAPDMTGIENLKAILIFNNSHLKISMEQLKKIFDISPTVEVTDLKHNSNEL